jgi:hypothetical protein
MHGSVTPALSVVTERGVGRERLPFPTGREATPLRSNHPAPPTESSLTMRRRR